MNKKHQLFFALSLLVCIGFFSVTNAQEKRINQVQVIGSHNSYKQAIDPQLFEYLSQKDTTGGINGLQYEHIAIIEQLDMGLRNLEIDAYVDKQGGKFANPAGMHLVSTQRAYDTEHLLNKPGFKVIHIPDIDYRTQYYLLEDCLNDLRKWSESNPEHETVFITLEPKDGSKNRFGTTPEPYNTEVYEALDKQLLKSLTRDHLIVPDDVRGSYSTLNEAVVNQNWPTIESGRGKFLFILDAKDEKRAMYIKGHPSLKDRVLFTNSEPGSPESGALIMNDAKDSRIPEMVRAGYIVRTRADANTVEARNMDYSNFEAAKKSGAQIITTDYYLPSTLFDSTYKVNFGEGKFSRANPINN
ncbi:phosphatidylinositol-specific phospholipase C1-like protein [Leeuwenhoekiella aequorea]|uniref:phosphatidylinositol-specific phospholipase C1-like protein n=1 Tax=Leeuwenhoekiella aequorea TaxID=283736 RepID=UPI00352F7F71